MFEVTLLWLPFDILLLLVRIIWAYLFAFYSFVWPSRPQNVRNKKVLVTGAAQGIGREIALQYGRLGAIVLCVDLNEKANLATVQHLRKNGVQAHAFTCDLTSKKSVTTLAEELKELIGAVDILVNNAGVLFCEHFLNQSPEHILSTLNVNILSNVWMLQAFLPGMKKKGSGSVVALSSAGGLEAQACAALYSTTKFAVRGLMESVRKEMELEGCDIRFTTICPYFTDTGMCKKPVITRSYIMDMLKPEDVAREVIAAQRRGYREVSIPKFIRCGIFLKRLLPDQAADAIHDFLGTGILAAE